MNNSEKRLEIGQIERTHSRDDVYAVLASGRLDPNDADTTLTATDEFIYRWSIAYDSTKDFPRLERFMLSMYGKAYLDSPELLEAYYKDVEVRARNVGQIALFANLRSESGLAAVTIGYLGETSEYPAHVRLNAQTANFDNTMGLSGLTRVKLEQYQRVAADQDGQVDILHSVFANTLRWNPFIVEHIALHDDLTTVTTRKDIHVGESEIKQWAEAHPSWQKWVEGTVRAVQVGTTNPIMDFMIPENTEGYHNLASFERLLDFERDDDL